MSDQVEESVLDSEVLADLEQGMTEEEVKTFETAFAENVDRLYDLIRNDPDKYYRCIAEIHVLLMMFEASIRSMMMNGGPKSFIKMMFGRG